MSNLAVSTVAQGLLWAVMALGVYVTFRVLDLADLTCEGSGYADGNRPQRQHCDSGGSGGRHAGRRGNGLPDDKNENPCTAGGNPYHDCVVFRQSAHHGQSQFILIRRGYGVYVYPEAATLVIGIGMYWFFGTEIGAAIRATGFNQQMIRAQGVNTDMTIILGLIISNALIAISGALVGQNNGFADVGMGVGTIVIGLASVIIGEVLFGTRSFKNCMISVVLGSVVYRIVIAVVLQMGMPPNDLKLFTSVLVAVALSMPLIKAKFKGRKVAR